jgi:uncharacterized protein YjbI with pentapeptide repeats
MNLTTTVGVLSKILGLGISAWGALKNPDFEEKDLLALRALFDAGGGILEAAQSRQEPEAAAKHLALITRSFGQAFGRHWAFNKDFVGVGRFRTFMSKEQKQRAKEIEVRTHYAAQKMLKMGEYPIGTEELSLVSSLAGSPLNTGYYRAFWDAFSNPKLSDEQQGEPPLLDLTNDTRREFERHFLIAYWEDLATSTGHAIASYIEGLEKYRALLIRELLLKDISTWNERHLFGNTERSKTPQSYGLPFMPLGAMYVEPNGVIAGSDDIPTPILSLLTQVLRQQAPKVIFIKADFGSGKSLTARAFANQLATTLLTTQQGPSLDQEFPIFIRCADDFPSEGTFELSPTVRRAWKRQAASFDVDLKTSDSALSLLGSEQRTTYILDGLDEIALSERRLDAMIQRLQEETTDNHRFIIFTRPSALPPDHKLKNSIVINLLPFATHDLNNAPGGQVREWLEKWNRVVGKKIPLQPEHLAKQDLLKLSKTPILLFMIAQSWDDISSAGTPRTLAEIYEGFFRHIARGKHELDRESNTNVFEASKYLLDHLKRLNEIGTDATAPDAMLWLMSRVAWEATKREQHRPPEPLTTRDVDRLLEDELELRPSEELISTIRMGLLLAMQADLRAGADHILFGHKSFREFLVARFWADRLLKIASTDYREWTYLESSLYGGRLLSDDAHLEFLTDLLDRLDSQKQSQIMKWAQTAFHNEEQIFKTRKGRSSSLLRDDYRATLREAALAVGCALKGSRMEIREPLALRSLLAWFLGTGQFAVLLARGAILRDTNLSYVQLFNSAFTGSNFEQVNLSGIAAGECDFSEAHLINVDFEAADCADCWFDRTQFKGGSISYSRFNNCLFRSSSFKGCHFEGTNFSHCNLDFSEFENVGLYFISMKKCSLTGARLSGCALVHTDLEQVDLSDVTFENTQYTKDVVWPKGFTPSNHPGLNLISR